jgi:hypothetical protein
MPSAATVCPASAFSQSTFGQATAQTSQSSFFVITRYDWPGPILGNEGQALRDWTPENQIGERQVYAARLWKWALDYAPYASGGFENDSFDDGRALVDFTAFASK